MEVEKGQVRGSVSGLQSCLLLKNSRPTAPSLFLERPKMHSLSRILSLPRKQGHLDW